MDVTATKDSSKLTTVEGETKDSFKGIKATELTINGGNYTINTVDKAIKADTELKIDGGTFNITSIDDAIHSDSNVTIDGESTDITISAGDEKGDDGIHANETLTIENGKILITKSYEGLEAYDIQINGGDINLTASDDGINAAGGMDGSGTGNTGNDWFGPGGNMGGMMSTSTGSATINGGRLEVTANGDGLDANGDITMNGGEVYVFGPQQGGNGILDFDGSFTVNGGVLVGAGTSDMAQTPSGQVVIATSVGTQSAGTSLKLTDSNGNEIISCTPDMQYQYVIITTPDLVSGQSYNLYYGTQSTTVTGGSVSGGGNTGGMQPGGRW